MDAVEQQGTTIYVLPDIPREQPSWNANAPCTDNYDGHHAIHDAGLLLHHLVGLSRAGWGDALSWRGDSNP
ncbi:MAG: hypothetical protein ACLFRD_06925 [Nitriliruptoraceae bacterium]